MNAADSASLGFGILFGAMPALDADGLRRFNGISDAADMGAYERGDMGLVRR